MVQSLDHLSIGSPLPNSSDLIAQQMINGQIEVMNNLWSLHNYSSVVLRSTPELGKELLNGSWTFTPPYVEKQKHPLSYVLGHMQSIPGRGYNDLMIDLCTKAEQEFYYGPLRALRRFILNENKPNDREQLKLPDFWYVNLDKTDARNVIGVVNQYCTGMPCIAKDCSSALYLYLADCADTSLDVIEESHILVSSKGSAKVLYGHAPDVGYVDMTSIFNFLCSPFEHGLKQDILQQYRKAVNL